MLRCQAARGRALGIGGSVSERPRIGKQDAEPVPLTSRARAGFNGQPRIRHVWPVVRRARVWDDEQGLRGS